MKAGYTNKERAAQMAEREAHKYDEIVRDAEIAKLMKEESARAEALKKQRELEKYQEGVRYQQELERQLEVINSLLNNTLVLQLNKPSFRVR